MGPDSMVVAALWCSLYTVLAAILAGACLRGLRIRSPRVHRIAWALVILQGWLILPWEMQLPLLSPPVDVGRPEKEELAVIGGVIPGAMENSATTGELFSSSAATVIRDTGKFAPAPGGMNATLLLGIAWAVGCLACAVLYGWRFFTMTRKLPLGHAPDVTCWNDEWSSAKSQWGIRHQVELRVTRDTGPLLCFVPFAYFVLTPCRLWTRLTSPERTAILKHELAHLLRGDLWKSLAIRVLALPQWFNPVVWLAVRKFDEAAEWACDDMVLGNRSCDRISYAKALVRLGDSLVPSAPHAVAAGGGVLTRRIERLIVPRITEDRVMKKMIVVASLLAVSLVHLVRVELVAQENPPVVEADANSPTDDAPLSLPHPAGNVTAKDLERTGLKPYVIGSPDILSIDAVKVDAKLDIAQPGQLVPGESEQQIEGKHLVGPDGAINLDAYGKVQVAGLTLAEAKQAIESHLSEFLEQPEVSVGISANNSKVCYVIVEGDEKGDHATVMPITGNETVLDAIGLVGGVSRAENLLIFIARLSEDSTKRDQILPVDWHAIVRGGDTRTNYQLLPGDRLMLTEKPENSRAFAAGHRPANVPPPTRIDSADELVEIVPTDELIAAEQDLLDNLNTLERAIKLAETSRSRVIAAREQLAAVQKAYDAGAVTIDLLLDAQRRAVVAEIAYVEALVDAKGSDTGLAKAEDHRLLAIFKLKHAQQGREHALETWKNLREKNTQIVATDDPAEAQVRGQYFIYKSIVRDAALEASHADVRLRRKRQRSAPYGYSR